MYQLRPGQSGQLSLPVVPSMREHAPSSPAARFWYYDPQSGYWKRTGDAVLDPSSGAYAGKVEHLSFINTDIAKFDAACLKVTLDPSIALGLRLRIRYHSGGTLHDRAPPTLRPQRECCLRKSHMIVVASGPEGSANG
ncbi:hypothetical protein [Hyalangium rubrum]|uniref:Uncharacterized protein n=1 Tax=Hyalangium rubrum TaxID=3103134 RepID=A0ABU5H7A2_9BACT|nr:hypothetical protein [Hyalangium sp. s54d21]MDY7229354.1 hypothetical protein [Hyalangium sp. s54d21]